MADRVMELIAKAAPYLATHGSGSPRLDAELLLAQALDITRMDLYLQFERPLSASELDHFRALCRRRAGGEPIAYIRGHREFMSVDLLVDPAVMIPRPETEILVEEALRFAGVSRASVARALNERPAAEQGAEEPPGVEVAPLPSVRVLDVGTGSGAIAIAMAVHHPRARVVGTDISADALAVARRNVERLELLDRVELRQDDLAAGVEGVFDLVLANLPYIDPDWPDAVTPEVLASEPARALFGGAQGLELVARLLEDVPRLTAPGSRVLLEVDPRNAAEALRLARGVGEARLISDLAGHHRVVVVEL